MSKKDDKHLELIKKRGFLDRSPESLKKYQTKITKLANSLRKDILDDDVRELFSKGDLEAIEQAAAALGGFKNTVAHAREYAARERIRADAAHKAAMIDAMQIVKSKYANAGSTYLNKLRFAMSVKHVLGAELFRDFIDELKQRVENDSQSYIASFPEWVDSVFNEALYSSTRLIVGYFGEHVDHQSCDYHFEKIDAALTIIDKKGGDVFHDAAWYLSKTTDGLSDADKKALGIQG